MSTTIIKKVIKKKTVIKSPVKTLSQRGNYQTTNINDLELVYSLLRERHPDQQIEIEYNDNTKEYKICLTNKPFVDNPEVPLDLTVKVVYGDSVTGDTPILLRNPVTKNIIIKTIEEICLDSEYIEYPNFKILDQSIRLEKMYALTNLEVWSDSGWNPIKKVIKHKCDKKIYRIVTESGCVDVTEDHSLCTPELEKIKPNQVKVNQELLHSFPSDFKQPYPTLMQLHSDVNGRNEMLKTGNILCICSSKLEAMISYYIYKDSCDNIYVEYIKSDNKYKLYGKVRQYDLHGNLKDPPKKLNSITNIIELGQITDFVYDLETEHGKFHAGIGSIIVFNTDSIFISFKYNRDNFEKNRQDTFRLATVCGDNITNDVFNRRPIELEFEKVFQPFILLTKKRYIGKKFEDTSDPFKLKTTTTAGIAVTRRDFANFTKKCYKEIIDLIMENKANALEDACELYKKYIDKLTNYQIDLQDIVISAQIGKEYSCKTCKKKVEWVLKCEKCKTLNPKMNKICQGNIRGKPCKKEFECVHTFSLGHINLAQRQLFRNEEVQVGDRIQYIFVESENANAQKNELAEDPVYAEKNALKFNRGCYLEQLGKTLLAFFKITLAQRQDLLDDIIEYTNTHLVDFGNKKLKASDYKIDDE